MKRPFGATYRLQFEKAFPFEAARELIPYLRDLGVTHLYCSPIFTARPGSRHGYDVVDHGTVNPELGGIEGFRLLAAHARAQGLGIVLDIVPNHAGVGSANERWLDVLEFGPHSHAARFFDIDWTRGPLSLPILGEDLGTVLEAGALSLEAESEPGRLVVAYHDHRLPLRPASVVELIAGTLPASGLPAGGREAIEAWAALDGAREPGSETALRRRALRRLLAALPDGIFEEVLADRERAGALLARQHWRLMHWREAGATLTYRRFFDITDLAGLRAEDPAVFEVLHRLPVSLIDEGLVDGLRVDHVDGLADPETYTRMLRRAAGTRATIHLEKILGDGEDLRDWPVDGTTGYETINRINGLFVDPRGYATLEAAVSEAGAAGDPVERLESAKREILATSLRAEVASLAAAARPVLARRGVTAGRRAVARAVTELVAALPVYRTYLDAGPVNEEDRRLLGTAAARAAARLGRTGRRVLQGLVDLMLSGEASPARARLLRKLQQLSGPAMAKGYEDTELYRRPALLSVNEVGSHAGHGPVSPEAFHTAMAYQAERFPKGLVPLSTHDTKRGSDTRARLNLLSEIAPEWLAQSTSWRDRHAALRARLGAEAEVGAEAGAEAPDAIDETLVYQTMFGVWPVGMDRIGPYLEKALREAKRHTTWTRQNPAYERAVLAFARELAEGDREGPAFRADLDRLVGRLAVAGRTNGLAQTLLQLTVPGVPDIYRGSEFWDHVLVDPDNRGPVDWRARREGLETRHAPDLAEDHLGFAKQRLIADLLALRSAEPQVFAGRYLRLATAGADGTVAFARVGTDAALVVAVSTRATAPGDDTAAVALPFQRWSVRRVVAGGPGDVVDNSLRFRRSDLPAAVLVDVLPE